MVKVRDHVDEFPFINGHGVDTHPKTSRLSTTPVGDPLLFC